MATRVLGKAEYQAYRTGRLVTLTARGEFPNFNDKADFEQLPFRIFPPQYGFYFIHQDISLPATRPFCYSEVIVFPANAPSITIVDVDGRHDIPVATQEPGQRGRPRRQRTDDQIIEAALALVREGGPQKVTVGSVAARSAVARTTIYRRYRDRDELLRTALNRIADQAVPPNHLSVGEKLRWVLTRVRVVLEEGLGRGGVAAVLADSDPQFTEAFRSALALHLEPLKVSIAVDTDSGFLRPDVDADVAVNLFFGAYLGEVLRYGEPRPDWLDRTLNMLALALYAPDQQ